MRLLRIPCSYCKTSNAFTIEISIDHLFFSFFLFSFIYCEVKDSLVIIMGGGTT